MNETQARLTSAGPQGSGVESAAPEFDIRANLDYWRNRLAGVPPALELPLDRPRPPVQRFQPGILSHTLSENLGLEIERLSQVAECSTYQVLLTAFQVLLFRYTGQADLVLGCYFPETERLVVLRSDLSGNPSFQTLLHRVTGDLQSACERVVTLNQLLDELELERDPSRNALFQVLFSVDEGLRTQAEADEARASAAPVDLHLHIRRCTDGTIASFTYDRQLFETSTILRIAEQLEVLLGSVTVTPNESIASLPILTGAERNKLLIEWNQTQADYPRDLCVHHLFEQQAQSTPQATAVIFEGNELSYAELDRRANQLANYLRQFGLKPDALVGLCVERGLDMVVGLLGILKAGAAYVPLDPAFPSERLAFMLQDAEAPVLLTQRHLVDALPASQARVVCLDAEWPTIATENEQRLAIDVTPGHLAYTIYTSGSTGKPKGVQVLHRGVVNFLTSMTGRPGITSSDRVLSVTTLSFDIAGLEIYLPLIVGGSVEIVSREVAADGNELLKKLGQSHATLMQATPATWRMLIEAGWEGTPGLKILCGGEALSQKLANQLLDRCASLWNMYGPTETTIWSTLSQVQRGHSTVLIGHPIANTQIYILDGLLQPAPIGVAGELHIGGDGVARGYLKRLELSQSKFIPDPFSRDPRARLYKTGDLARYLSTGEIEFLGRIDHQVKIRGFRIELGEIETLLRQHPTINDAVVIDREDTPGDKRLVAYLVPEQDANLTAGDLRAFLMEQLPEYMVPSAFVALKVMPLTPNGKVNRRALPAPDQSQLPAKAHFVSPRDDAEAGLAKIWEDILGVSPIGVRDNFFELGGHSLLAVRMMHRAAQRFDKKLPVATLFQAPTIELLAAMFRQTNSAPHWTSLVAIQPGDSRPPFFCIHGAGGVIIRFRELAQHLGPEQPVYGFQAQGLDESLACHTRVEDMAAHYIDEMRSIQPYGPYLVGGYSFGGLIALEMAQQLRNIGERAALVVLFDTFCTPARKAGASTTGLGDGIWSLLGKLLQSTTNEPPLKSARLIAKGIRRRWEHLTVPRQLKVVRRACEQAGRDYVPRNYCGKVVLFRSSNRPATVADPYEGWNHYIENGLEIHDIVSDHDGILLEPQVRIVAQQLNDCLRRLHSRLNAAEVLTS